MVTRGVVLDMTAYYGKAIVPGGTEFTVADIRAVLKKQGLSLRKGDVVLFNTGWLELIGKDDKQFPKWNRASACRRRSGWPTRASSPSVATPGPRRSTRTRTVPRSSRSTSTCWPSAASTTELIDSRALVRDKAWEFLFVLGQPLYVGSTQVNINPVAIR